VAAYLTNPDGATGLPNAKALATKAMGNQAAASLPQSSGSPSGAWHTLRQSKIIQSHETATRVRDNAINKKM
tara:strand:+ start:422 stop:637 length:216 start_codon:yes stop_codon:yes gene_type:complete